MGTRPESDGERPGSTRTQHFELTLRYEASAAGDPTQWRFTLSDEGSNEQVSGVGISGLAEAVALLATRRGRASGEVQLRVVSESVPTD